MSIPNKNAALAPARFKARRRAVEVLFEADQRGEDPLAVWQRTQARTDFVLNEFTGVLVAGVIRHLAEIDELLTHHSHQWSLSRMPTVDRCVLRLATYELCWGNAENYSQEPVPAQVVMSEAVKLAALLSTDDSPGFVNGVLAAISESGAGMSGETEDSPVASVSDDTPV